MLKNLAIRLMTPILISSLGLAPTAWAAAPAAAKAPEEFPKLISFFDLNALSAEDRTVYLEQLRELISDLADQQAASGAANMVANPPSSFLREADALGTALFTPAHADMADPTSVDSGCENDGHKTVCVTNFAGSQEQCLCEVSTQTLLDNYGTPAAKPAGCDVSTDPEAQLDIKNNYQTVYVGGSARCVTSSSYKAMATVMPPDLYASFSRAVTDPKKSEIFKTDKASRYVDLSKRSQAYAQSGSVVDPFSGQTTDHFFRADGPGQDARVGAQVAVDDGAKAKDMAALLKSKDPDVAAQAATATLADVKDTKAAADLADAKAKEALKSADTSVNDADATPKGEGAAKTMDATSQSVAAGSTAGIVGADLHKASDDLKKVDADTPASDTELKKTDEQDGGAIKAASDAVLKAGSDLIAKAQEMLHLKADELNKDGATSQLTPLQAQLTKLREAVAKGDVDGIQKSTAAAKAKIEDTRDAMNLPSDDPAHENGNVTCLKTGTFTCANRKTKKIDTPAMVAARTAYLATTGDKKCIFGGNSSEFDKDAIGRNGKTRLGCQAVTEFSYETGGKTEKITCPTDSVKGEKPVLCNPMLYGYEKDAKGNVSGHCVDWNTTVTSSCNYKYPLSGVRGKKVAGMTQVSATDFLTSSSNKLEPQWNKLSDAISHQCNTKEFRSLNCNECELIALRLSAMKAYATKDTCVWPSELATVRKGMSGGATSK